VTFLNADPVRAGRAVRAAPVGNARKGQVTLELPLVLTDDEALNIANALLFDAWAAREAFAFQVSRAYAKYEPGDVVTLPFPAGDTSEVRITKRDDGANGVIRWEGQFTDASVYTQDGSTQAAPPQADTITLSGPTLFHAARHPAPARRRRHLRLLRRGARLPRRLARRAGLCLARRRRATTRRRRASSSSSRPWATPRRRSPPCTLVEQFDEAGTVDVKLVEGTLSSVTRDQVLDGSNVALLGDEIIQFRTATQLAAQRYRLTGLLRGRLGTDWAVGTPRGERALRAPQPRGAALHAGGLCGRGGRSGAQGRELRQPARGRHAARSPTRATT
jgi:hypothetical protein